ncbi:aspartyl protease family protein [Deltaproteobacteria bacterium TL4]
MGKVVVKDVVLRNQDDISLVRNGYKDESSIRTITLDMIADTGAKAIGLPRSIIEKLGLQPHREVTVTLSNGLKEKRMLYNGLHLRIGDRDSVFECIAKPEEAPCLLGQLVLETLDFVVDCPNHRLIPNPSAPDGMMMYDDF